MRTEKFAFTRPNVTHRR